MHKATPTKKSEGIVFRKDFFKGHDGLKLSYRFYQSSDAKDTLVILHGHGEHTGRYEKFAEYLKDLRLSIAMYDFRGHGESEGRHVYVDSYENFIDDVTCFTEHLSREHRIQGKILLLGHSNGGLVAVHWALRNALKVKALFLSSPCLGLKLPNFLVRFNDWMNSWAPKFVYSNPVYPPYLTHNEDELARYKKDPYIRRKISVRLLNQMINYMGQIRGRELPALPFPVFILMSGLDRVVDANATRGFFDLLKTPDKDLTEFKEFYHEIFNEKGQEDVFRVLRDYIQRATSA